MKKFSAKRALLLSVLSMVICVSMLIGSTFAWFTDSATANVNTIQSGNLDVDLQVKNADGEWVSAEGTTPLNFVKLAGHESEAILWEPGCTYNLPELRVVNNGNLALKYQLVITGATGDTMLLDVIKFKAVVTPEGGEAATSENAYGTTIVSDGELLAGKYATLNISAHMDETAGNDYMKKSVSGISVKVVATQLAHEYDSNGNTYDADAPYTTVNVSSEEELRAALYNAPTNGIDGVKIVLQGDVVLNMLYAAENFGTVAIKDNEIGDTLNRYKLGVHPTEDDPTHWNPLVTNQTQEEKEAYGAYFHTGAGDERIARLVVKAGQNVIIDLNGHNLSKDPRATHGDWTDVCTSLIGNYGTLSIIDSAGTGLITGSGMKSCSGGVIHNYGGTLTIRGAMIDGGAEYADSDLGQYVIVNGDQSKPALYTNGKIVLDGAFIYDSATSASLICNNVGTMVIKNETVLRHDNTKVINCKGGEVFLESAKITSNEYAVYAKGGTVTVTDSAVTIKGTGTMTENGGAIIHK